MSDSNNSAQKDNDRNSDRLFIFSVRIPLDNGKIHKSSVSMDGFLAECLIDALGNQAEAARWVEAQAIQIREEALPGKVIRRVGVSRLVQREALKIVLKNRCSNES